MRLLPTLTLSLLLPLAARADLLVEQKVESPMMTGTITTKIRPEVARIDSPSPAGGNVTVIINTGADQMTSLMHQQKMAMTMKLSDMRSKADAAQKQMGIDPAKAAKPTATGQKEKVGVWDTEVYSMTNGGITMKFWVAKDFPDYAKFKDSMVRFSKAASGGALDPNSFDLPGMVVKSEGSMPQGKMTTTLVGIKEITVPDAEYVVPEGYQTMSLPGQ